MKLLIDVGNSRIKWAYLIDRELSSPEAHAYNNQELQDLLATAWAGRPQPEQVYIANVAGKDAGRIIEAVIAEKWNVSPVFAEVEREYAGVTNAYDDVTQLGIDRWLAVIAAWIRFRSPACIVSCGTAVTIDVIADSGQHLGGFILPGLEMMQDLLIKRTSGIKAKSGNQFKLELGTSTAECINYGSVRAIVAAIDNVVEEIKSKFGRSLSLVITGGYAGSINSLLKNRFDHDPYLILAGLAIIAERRT